MQRSGFYERVAKLVELAFDAPASQHGWDRMLAALCEQLAPGVVAMILGRIGVGGPFYLLGHGLDSRRVGPEQLMPAADHPTAAEVPVGAVFAIPRASPLVASTPLYRNVLAHEGIAGAPGFCVVLGRDAHQITGALLVLSRDPAWEPRDEDQTLLSLLTPYVIRATSLGLHLQERQAGIEALLEIFDALVLGVLLLDEDGNLSFANRSAAALLGVAPGFASPGPATAGRRLRLDEALRALARRVFSKEPTAHSLSHPADGQPLHVVVTPLDWTGDDAGSDGRFATAIFVGDPRPATAGTTSAFGKLHALTPSEERLALELATGASLAEAAAQLGIRTSTARGVLRAVFEKTGTHRQASLVRLVLTTAGQVRLPPPRG